MKMKWFLMFLALLATTNARASNGSGPTIPRAFEVADFVGLCRVVGARSELRTVNNRESKWIVYRMAVAAQWKGQPSVELEWVRRQPEKIFRQVREGGLYLVYLKKHEDEFRGYVRYRAVDDALVDLRVLGRPLLESSEVDIRSVKPSDILLRLAAPDSLGARLVAIDLKALVEEGAEYIPALIGMVESANRRGRPVGMIALGALGGGGEAGVECLQSIMRWGDPAERTLAMRVLALHADVAPEVRVRCLLRGLEDRSSAVRTSAVDLVYDLASPARLGSGVCVTVSTLERLRNSDPDDIVRGRARATIEGLRRRDVCE